MKHYDKAIRHENEMTPPRIVDAKPEQEKGKPGRQEQAIQRESVRTIEMYQEHGRRQRIKRQCGVLKSRQVGARFEQTSLPDFHPPVHPCGKNTGEIRIRVAEKKYRGGACDWSDGKPSGQHGNPEWTSSIMDNNQNH